MTTKFKVYVTRDISEHDTFEEAFKAFFEEVIKMIDAGTMTVHYLETVCWIEGTFQIKDETFKVALHFYGARDFAHNNDLLELKDGKITVVDPMPTIPVEVTSLLFANLGPKELKKLMEL